LTAQLLKVSNLSGNSGYNYDSLKVHITPHNRG